MHPEKAFQILLIPFVFHQKVAQEEKEKSKHKNYVKHMLFHHNKSMTYKYAPHKSMALTKNI